jgi:hypothetical protein
LGHIRTRINVGLAALVAEFVHQLQQLQQFDVTVSLCCPVLCVWPY